MLTTLSSSTLKNVGFSSIKEHIVSISRNLIKDDVSLHYLLLVCATLVPLYSFGESKEEKLQVTTTPSSALYMDILITFFKAGCPERPRKKKLESRRDNRNPFIEKTAPREASERRRCGVALLVHQRSRCSLLVWVLKMSSVWSN
jgi:hypothetical protein